MPALQLLGRSWHVSSDDLVVPAWVGVAFHGTWTALIAAEVAILGLPDDCERSHLATSSVLWLLISFAVTTFLQCVVAGISMRGAMLEEHKRAAMPAALCSLLAAYAMEASALVYATVVNFGVLGASLSACHTAEELARTSISELTLHRWFVGSTWGMLMLIGGLLVLMYNLYPDRGLESWEKRVDCLSHVLCCKQALTNDGNDDDAAQSASTVVRLARVLADLFYPLNFSFTDTVTAIILVGITHRSSAHGHGSSSHNHALIAAAGAGVLEANSKEEAAVGTEALLKAAVAATAARSPNRVPITTCILPHRPDTDAPFHAALGSAAVASTLTEPTTPTTSQLTPSTNKAPGSTPAMTSPFQHEQPLSLESPQPANAGQMPPDGAAVSCTRSPSGSAWEAAVRHGSTLAVAPGRGLVPSPEYSPAQTSNSSTPMSQWPQGVGVGARSLSTADATVTPEGPRTVAIRPVHRAISWSGSGSGAAQQPSTEHCREVHLPQVQALNTGKDAPVMPSTLHTLEEGNEASVTLSVGLQQVESLLSPLPSHDIAAEAGEGAALTAAPAAASLGHSVSAMIAGSNGHCVVSNRQRAERALVTASGVQGIAPAAAAAAAHVALQAAAAAAADEAAEVDLQAEGAVTSNGQPVSLELLEEALHWHTYANAVYGWPMFLWSHRYRVLRCCRLCCGGVCTSSSDSSPKPGLSPHLHRQNVSAYHTSAASSKTGSFDDSKGGLEGRQAITTVVTLSSVDTDAASPESTAAGAAGPLVPVTSARGGGPVAEGVEEVQQQLGLPRQAPAAEAAAAAANTEDYHPVGDPGHVRAAQGQTCTQETAQASDGPVLATRSTDAATGRSPVGVAAAAGAGEGRRQLVAPNGNMWLRQSMVDALSWDKEAVPPAVHTQAATNSTSTPAATPRPAAAAANGAVTGHVLNVLAGKAAAAAAGADDVRRKKRLSSAAGGLSTDEGLCGCLCGGRWGASHVPKIAPLTASQRLTNEAIMQTANIPAADLLYVNYSNLIEGLLPYSVALDVSRQCVVVAIRGSLSVEDCVTDILYDPAPLDEGWLLQPHAAPARGQAAAPCTAAAAGSPWWGAEQGGLYPPVALPAAVLQQQQQPDHYPFLTTDPLRATASATTSTAGAAAGAAAERAPSRSMLGASSGGGSLRSVKASPFASAAAAASMAARNSSTGGSVEGAVQARPGAVQPRASLIAVPSVPAAQQAAAAAAAAAVQPFPPAANKSLRKQWSINYAGLQQQQPSLPHRLSEHPSFVRRTSTAHRLMQPENQQQQQLTSRPSVLEAAWSVIKATRQRLTGSDTGNKHSTDGADAAAEEGRMPGLSRGPVSGTQYTHNTSPRQGPRGWTGTELPEPSSASSTPRNLLKTFSLNLTAVLTGGKGLQGQQGGGVQGVTPPSSSRLRGTGHSHVLQSCTSEIFPSSTNRRSTVDSWMQSQTRRTTAADRALGASRVGHKYAPLTSQATSIPAAAAAASQRSLILQQHKQQQQHHQQALSSTPSMICRAPATLDAAPDAEAAAACGPSGHGSSAVGTGQPCSASVSGRTTTADEPVGTELPGDNGTISSSQQQQQQQPALPQQQHRLLSMVSLPVPSLRRQQHDGSWVRAASEEGSIVAGAGHSSTSDRTQTSFSFAAPWVRQQQQQQLLDGGPTDWSLLSGAATMLPSRTAAVPRYHQPGVQPGAVEQRLSSQHSTCPGLQAPGSAGAPGSGNSGFGRAACLQSPGVQPLSTAAGAGGFGAVGAAVPAGWDAADDASPFMLHQAVSARLEVLHSLDASAAAQEALDRSIEQSHQQPWPHTVLSVADLAKDEAAAMQAADGVTADVAEGAAEAAAAAEADAVAAAAQAAAAEDTPDTGAAGAQWFAHEGILNCARAIRDDLDRLGLLDQLLLGAAPTVSQAASREQQRQEQGAQGSEPQGSKQLDCGDGGGATAACAAEPAGQQGGLLNADIPDCKGWTLVLTGHSLGAGVAALLALHYRARYESVRAWCFAPPGGLLSPAAAASLKDICYSLVSAKDMIPRMSLWTIERLRDEMMICALRCKVPKYQLLLGAAFGKKWTEDEVLKPLERLSDAEVSAFQSYRHAVVEERSLDPLRVRIAREFVPPGEVLWLERCKEMQPRFRVANTRGAAATSASQPTAVLPSAAPDAAGDAAPRCAGSEAAQPQAAAGSKPAAPETPQATPLTATSGAATGSSKTVASTSMLRGSSAALEAAAVAVAGMKVVSRLQPHITDGLGIIVGGMVVSRNMFADHIPDKQLQQLRRLVRGLKRRQALGLQLPAGVTPVTLVRPPQAQHIPDRDAPHQLQH